MIKDDVITAAQAAFEYPPRCSFTLIVFVNSEHATLTGFRGHRHPLDEKLMAWWPSASEAQLCGRVFPKIIISRGARISRETEELLRNRQMTFKNRIWIEL